MTLYENYIVYPDGEAQEIPGPLRLDQIVDLNGRPLAFPLPDNRLIAYRVVKIRRSETRGEEASFHYVELVPARELASYT
jgi:hypothetical protein